MKKIYYSALLTAVVAMVGLKLAGWQHASPLGKMDREGLFIGEVKTSADSTVPEPVQAGGRPGNWRTVVAGVEPRLARPHTVALADPVGAFQRWAREFMDGTADLEEGLRLAGARRVEMARLIRDNPRQAIDSRIDDDTREALPEAIRGQLEQPIHGTGKLDVRQEYRLAKGEHPVAEAAGNYPGLDPRLVRSAELDSRSTRLETTTFNQLSSNGKTYTAHTYGRLFGLGPSGSLPFNGIALDGHAALDESPVRLMGKTATATALAAGQAEEARDPVTGETASLAKGGFLAEAGGNTYVLSRRENARKLGYKLLGAEAGVSPSRGENYHINAWDAATSQGDKDVLIIRLNFIDDPAEPPSAALLESTMKEVNDFFVESSYGTLSLTPTITPTLTLPRSKLWYEQGGQTLIKDSAIELAVVSGYDTTLYDFIMIAVGDLPGSSFEGWVVSGFAEGMFVKGYYVEAICRKMGSTFLGSTQSADYWDTVAPDKIEPDPMSEDPAIPHSLADLLGRDSMPENVEV